MKYRDYMLRCAADYLAALLVKHDGCVRAVATEAGIHRGDVYKKLRKLGLVSPTVRGNDAWRSLQ